LIRQRARGSHSCGARGSNLFLVTLVGGLLINACGKPLAKPECEALLLRYVTLLAASDRPETSSAERAHMLEKAKEKAAGDPEMARCGSSVSRAQFNCAMVAPSTDEFERCLM
jgi:hypothetical protein